MTTASEISWDEVKKAILSLIEQAKETDRRMQETDRRMQETDRRLQETDRIVQQVSRQIGQLGQRLGDFVEEMVEPAVVALFQARGLQVTRTMQNVVCRDNVGQLRMEVDLLVVDGDTAIAVECKSHLSVEDVKVHVERLGLFKACWPEYAAYRLMGAVAAMVVPDEVASFAYRQGLYVLAPSGETMALRNDEKFVPRLW